MQIHPPCGAYYHCRHSNLRQAQRSFFEELIELLLAFAWPQPAREGAYRYRFDKETWAEAAEWLGSRAAQLERFRHAYLIEDGSGKIITVAWKH